MWALFVNGVHLPGAWRDLEGFSPPGGGHTTARPTLCAQRPAGLVLNRHNTWDENQTQLGDILTQLCRNSRLLCTRCLALHACCKFITRQWALLRFTRF